MKYSITLVQDYKKKQFHLNVSDNYPYDSEVPVMDQDCFLIDALREMLPQIVDNTTIVKDDIKNVSITVSIEMADQKKEE